MEIDESTGLPVLPEGYFWSVRGKWLGFAEIQLRKKFRWFGSWKVDYATRYDFNIDAEAIRTFTRLMWEDNFGPGGRISAPKPSPREFYGNYPPKSL